jgi:FkbM family methyltransferase
VHNSGTKVVYDKGSYYEEDLTNVFTKILKRSLPNSRVIDVGGNIGWFTFLSAANGHHVDVFEPNPVNIIRQCESMYLNGWSNALETDIRSRTSKRGSINLRQYGVGSSVTQLRLFMGKNPGAATVSLEGVPRRKRRALRQTQLVDIITLDGLADTLGFFRSKSSPIVILKVDVEGFEPSVFQGAQKLLRSGIVENILMEVSGKRDNHQNEEMILLIQKSGYRLHGLGFSSGPTAARLPDYRDEKELVTLILTKVAGKGQQVNLWWKWNGRNNTFQ